MHRARRPRPPLDQPALERLALRYVERFATTRGRLAAYLSRKIAERGWDGATPADPAALADRFAERGYVDDRGYATARAAALTRRGIGAHRIEQALRHAGIAEGDRQEIGDEIRESAEASALAFARRRRIGPYALSVADRIQRERHIAAMVRAGHPLAIARKIVSMAPGDEACEEIAQMCQDE
jgi:regulatory protein